MLLFRFVLKRTLGAGPGARRLRTAAIPRAGTPDRRLSSAPDEGQQVRIHPVFERRAQAVRRPRIYLKARILDQFGREQPRGVIDRDDLIVVAVDDKGRHVESSSVLGELRLGERFDAVDRRRREPAQHPLKPERVPQALRHLRARPVGHRTAG